jgi:hypothetical protein
MDCALATIVVDHTCPLCTPFGVTAGRCRVSTQPLGPIIVQMSQRGRSRASDVDTPDPEKDR